MTIVYRIQPAGLDIHGHCSETSSGEEDCGVHVFLSLNDCKRGIKGWMADDTQPELLTIECQDEDLEDNEDYEGMTLVDGCGTIRERRTFVDWDNLYDWAG